MLKCLLISNKFLLLCWFKFLLLVTNFIQNRITLLLVLNLLQSTKLTSRIYLFIYLLHHDVFVSSVFFFFNFFLKNFITLISHFYFPKSLLLYLKKKKRKKKDSYYKTNTITSIHPYHPNIPTKKQLLLCNFSRFYFCFCFSLSQSRSPYYH